MTSTTVCELQKALADAEKTQQAALRIQSDSLAEIACCPHHGEYRFLTDSVDLAGRKIALQTKCPECAALYVKELQEKLSTAKTAEIQRLKANSGVPLRFAESSFKNYEAVNQGAMKALALTKRYAEKWLDRLAKGGGLVFCGKPGTGKNHLACAIANQIIEQYQARVSINTALRIAREIKSTWGRESQQSESEAIKSYTTQDLLIIDEIGVQFGSEAEKIILFEIINTRYENRLPTILISNLSEMELGNYIGERVLDRMREGQGAVVVFDWESYWR